MRLTRSRRCSRRETRKASGGNIIQELEEKLAERAAKEAKEAETASVQKPQTLANEPKESEEANESLAVPLADGLRRRA